MFFRLVRIRSRSFVLMKGCCYEIQAVPFTGTDVDENLNHEIEFIIRSNEGLAENKMKNEIQQLSLKYKHRNNIHVHKHRKQQNE